MNPLDARLAGLQAGADRVLVDNLLALGVRKDAALLLIDERIGRTGRSVPLLRLAVRAYLDAATGRK